MIYSVIVPRFQSPEWCDPSSIKKIPSVATTGLLTNKFPQPIIVDDWVFQYRFCVPLLDFAVCDEKPDRLCATSFMLASVPSETNNQKNIYKIHIGQIVLWLFVIVICHFRVELLLLLRFFEKDTHTQFVNVYSHHDIFRAFVIC